MQRTQYTGGRLGGALRTPAQQHRPTPPFRSVAFPAPLCVAFSRAGVCFFLRWVQCLLGEAAPEEWLESPRIWGCSGLPREPWERTLCHVASVVSSVVSEGHRDGQEGCALFGGSPLLLFIEAVLLQAVRWGYRSHLLLGSPQRAGWATFLPQDLGEAHLKRSPRGTATVHLSWSLRCTFQKAALYF